MPRKIKNNELPLLWELAKESMYAVQRDSNLFDVLDESKSMWQFLWNCDIDNRSAIMHWSRDLKIYAAEHSKEYNLGWGGTNVLVMAGHLSRFCMGRENDAYDTKFYANAQKYKFFKKAPYVFWAPGRKLTAYFVGNKALKAARKVAVEFQRHCEQNNMPKEFAADAYRNARHLVCTIAALAPNKINLLSGYQYSCALQGKPVVDAYTKMTDEQVELYREYILLNKSDETLPDIVGILQGE